MGVLSPPLSGIPSPSNAPVLPAMKIGSAWRRIGAAIVDFMLVGAAMSLVAIPLFDFFSRLGGWGHFVGFLVALPYFVLLNSRLGQGQTLGKRWLKLRVVDTNGETLSFSKSMLRYAVLTTPIFLNGIELPVSRTPDFVFNLITLIIFGLGTAILYLVVFNRNTRQGVHDLAAGTYVVNAEPGVMQPPAIWKGHWAILFLILASGAVGAKILMHKVESMANISAMMEDVGRIESLPQVQSAGLTDTTVWSNGDKSQIYVVSIRWAGGKEEEPNLANKVAGLILRNDPIVGNRDFLRVVVVRGYDFGIAHAQVTRTFQHTPEEWKVKLGEVPSLAAPTLGQQ